MAEPSREFVNDIKSTGKQALDTGKSIYNDAKSEIKSKAEDMQSDMRSMWADRYDQIKSRAKDAYSTSEDFVKDHPVATVLGACAIGFVAGLLARRSRD
ncbi:YqjD family protein [Bdellovibrio sp. NC01]|uniref:DUF883 family protein n=1 Tax=Bdellovibrio sp. NC01 TaxID=2220073 RepID=UPI00115AC1FE|nr:DUF883 family protein [Bdellovibrio sp. NC01]QDK38379.1 hypothetical protein DOE51_12715 [Bdellovibrio sp. NC01]